MYIIFEITCVLLFGSKHRGSKYRVWVLRIKVLSKFFFAWLYFGKKGSKYKPVAIFIK